MLNNMKSYIEQGGTRKEKKRVRRYYCFIKEKLLLERKDYN